MTDMDPGLLMQMLAIDSTSGKEAAMADWLEANFKAPSVRSFDVGDGTRNLLFLWGEAPRVVFCSHMDTVPPYIPPVLEGDVIRGRGSCDAKGQLFAMYTACLELAERGYKDFALLAVSGEETGSWGAKAFARTGFSAPLLVIGEPTGNCMASASKGTKSFDLTFRGEAFHSGYPECGRSAVQMFVDFINALNATDFASDPVLGETTFNVGMLRSDNPQNILSPELHCRLYFRTTFASDAAVTERVRSLAGENIGCVERGGDTPSLYYTIEGFPSEPVAFGSDAPHLTGFGRKIICGPGFIKVAHRPEEYVTVSGLRAAADNYIRIYEHELGRTE